MKKIICIGVMFFIFHLSNAQNFKVVGYVANWGTGMSNITNSFPFEKVTHLNIAFKNPDINGNMPAMNTTENNFINKCISKNVKVLVSIGGANSADGYLKNIFETLTNPTYAEAYSEILKDYCIDNNLNGVDVDIEGAGISSNYGNFIKTLADTLHKYNLLCTAALSEGYGGGNVPTSTFDYFDFINIMAYDAVGPTWGSEGNHSTYSFAVNSVNYWKNRGLPKSKCILGVPFYGYGFRGNYSAYGIPFKNIISTYGNDAGWDDVAGNAIYFNGWNTIYDKTEYAKANAGGIMIWELSQDTYTNPNISLMDAIYSSSGPLNTFNETLEDQIEVYPNPVENILSVQMDEFETFQLSILSSNGTSIMESQNTSKINTENLPSGIYLLKIKTVEHTAYKKFIKQ